MLAVGTKTAQQRRPSDTHRTTEGSVHTGCPTGTGSPMVWLGIEGTGRPEYSGRPMFWLSIEGTGRPVDAGHLMFLY